MALADIFTRPAESGAARTAPAPGVVALIQWRPLVCGQMARSAGIARQVPHLTVEGLVSLSA